MKRINLREKAFNELDTSQRRLKRLIEDMIETNQRCHAEEKRIGLDAIHAIEAKAEFLMTPRELEDWREQRHIREDCKIALDQHTVIVDDIVELPDNDICECVALHIRYGETLLKTLEIIEKVARRN